MVQDHRNFSFMLYSITKCKKNIVVDVLSRSYVLLITIHTRFLGFEHIKALYSRDNYFSPIVENLKQKCVVHV